MKKQIKELKEIVLLKVTALLLRMDKSDRITWCHIGTKGKAERITKEDLKKVVAALTNDDFHGSFTISIFDDDSALIGWNINKNSEKTK